VEFNKLFIEMAKIFKATTAGSLPKPNWLAETEKLWPAWKDSGETLTEKKKKSAAMWIDVQEQSGLEIISEGEQFRIHFVHGFLETIEGINWDKKTQMGIRNDRYVVEVPTVTEPLIKSGSIHVEEAKFLRSKSKKLTKFTLPGPMTISDTIANEFYADKKTMAMEFAKLLNDEAKTLCDAGIDVIQFDEPAFNSFLEESIEWGMDALEVAIKGLDCKTAIHICYGYGIEENLNWKKTLGDQWRQYENLFPAINQSNINQVSLEFAGSRVPPQLMRLLPDKEIMVGVVSVVGDHIETSEEVEKNIMAALAHVEVERLIPSTNCGMAPISVDVAKQKLKALGEGTERAEKRIS
jgi:5-methyltetrahydropteroyltriglutamate--homocysteine methyltransferase